MRGVAVDTVQCRRLWLHGWVRGLFHVYIYIYYLVMVFDGKVFAMHLRSLLPLNA